MVGSTKPHCENGGAADRKLIDSRLGYFIRPGKHSMTTEDWGAFLGFADRHFRNGRRSDALP